MIRTGAGTLVALVAALLVTWGASSAPSAQPSEPESDSRFSFHRFDQGYLRLDGRTGGVSICNRGANGWLCRAVPDERAALEAEIARLQNEIALLKKEFLARDLPLPGGIRPQPPTAKVEALPQRPARDSVMRQAVNAIERVWSRVVSMIANATKDLLKRI